MSRIRSLKPEWLEDERLGASSDEARLLSVALILLADDYGNGRAHPLYLASRVWPYGDPPETLAKLSRAISGVEALRFASFYKVNGQAYFHITNWSRHQRVDHPGKPQVPGPGSADAEVVSRRSREALVPDLDQDQERRGEERAREPTEHPASKLRARWHSAYVAKTTLPWDFRTPKQQQLSAQLSKWIAEAGEASGLTYDAALERFVELVFASELGAQKKFRFEFVAACPEEFWVPVNGSAVGTRSYRKLSLDETRERLDREEAEERDRRRKAATS